MAAAAAHGAPSAEKRGDFQTRVLVKAELRIDVGLAAV